MSQVRRYTYTLDPVYDRQSLVPVDRSIEYFAPEGQYVSGLDHDAALAHEAALEGLLREALPHLRFCKGMGQKFAEKLDGLDQRIEALLATKG